MSIVKIATANKSNKQALEEWEEFLKGITDSTPVDTKETHEARRRRIASLEKPGNQEEWFAYYFPKYCFCEPADFHKQSSQKVLKSKRLYQRRAWARGLSKSTRRMFEVFYKIFVQKMRVNALLISKNEDNAIRLLAPYRANLEGNQRIIQDYGVQRKAGSWAEEEFVTRKGCCFRAVGMGQNPRGAKLEELRVNVLIFDDADDDEVVLNPERVENGWNWIEQAAIPTVEMSRDYFIFFDNNIIAEDCYTVRAAHYADDVETVNWRNEVGESTWPEKNKEADIQYLETHMSWESVQKEGYNNPVSHGKTFKEITYGSCPPMQSLSFMVAYADPSPSNRDKPTAKSKAHNSCKAVALLGCANNIYYLYNCWVDNTTNSKFIDWLFAAQNSVGKKAPLYIYIENNTLQNPFYEQVLLPMVFEKSKEYRQPLMLTPDTTIKPDKWTRIEATLEPLNRLGQLIFNIEQKDNPHMMRMAAQLKGAKANSNNLDGPDALQGGIKIIQSKTAVLVASDIKALPRPVNKKRY
jgi:hypothetical protein